MNTEERLQKALGEHIGIKANGKVKDEGEAILRDFLEFNPEPKKLDGQAGEIKVEPAGPMWRVTIISHTCWRKKTFYTEDLGQLVKDAVLAIADGNVPLERYKSMKQKKDPDKIPQDGA